MESNVAENQSKEVKLQAAQAEKFLLDAQGFEIETQDDYVLMAEALKHSKALFKNLDGEQKKATKPLNEAKKTIMDWFRPHLGFLTDAEKLMKCKMHKFIADQRNIHPSFFRHTPSRYYLIGSITIYQVSISGEHCCHNTEMYKQYM